MRVVIALLLAGVMLMSGGCVSGTIYGKPLDPADDSDTTQGTLMFKKIMEYMRNDDFDSINAMGYHAGQDDAETFETFWQQYQDYLPEYGIPETTEVTESYQFGDELVFVCEMGMEKGGTLMGQAMFTKAFDLVSLYLYETEEEDLAHTVMPDGITEEDIIVGEGTEYPLEGKITYPSDASTKAASGQKLRAVVLVDGDGANDMNMKAGCTYLYRDLAWGLAEQGVVTIRYNKRTLTYTDVVSDENATADKFTVAWEYTEDANRAEALLKTYDFVDPDQIYYVGHSQGAIVAPRAQKEGGDYAGFILINTSPRKWYDVIYDQYIHYGLVDQSSESIYYLVSRLKTERSFIADGKCETLPEDELTQDFLLTRPACFWNDFLSFDYVGELKNLQMPTLILQGGTDYQITVDRDYSVWQEEMADEPYVTMKCYDGLNHLMVESKGCFAGHYKEYDIPGRASQDVIDDIASFVLSGTVK